MENAKHPNEDSNLPKAHNDKAREEEVVRQRRHEKHETEDADRELREGKRTEMDAAHGEDAIEIDRNEGRRFTEASDFEPFDGDLGDESENMGDLSPDDLKNKNFYNSAASVGENQQDIDPKETDAMRIKNGRQAGVSYEDGDSYVKKDEQKGNQQK